MLDKYFSEIKEILTVVKEEEKTSLKDGANKIAEAVANGGIIHLFGCGHSHILTEEVFFRAGGLAPIRPIFYEPLMLHESAVKSSQLERENNYGKKLIENVDIKPNEVMLVLSTSGRNPVPVDVAIAAKEKGAFVIGITSIEYAKSQLSRHKKGFYLFDVVDLVIDNHAPPGDALLEHSKLEVKFAPSSTVIGSAIINGMIAESIKIMADKDVSPPVFLSGNIDGADNHNKSLIDKYSKRINF